MWKSAALRVVYIVDGDASVREALSRLMDSAGLQPRPCESVTQFLAQASGMRVACVLLDVWGARQCETAVRNALLAVAKVLPVIALSANDDPTVRQLARDLGARFFFRKPVDGEALLDSIEWVMQGDGQDAPH